MSNPSDSRDLRAAAAVGSGFVLVHLVLLSFSFDAIDLEELDGR